MSIYLKVTTDVTASLTRMHNSRLPSCNRQPSVSAGKMTSSDDDALASAAFCLVHKRHTRKKKRGVWCNEWLMKEKKYSHINLLSELKIYPRDWHNYVRMNEETYLKLLSLVTPLIKRQDTIMREAITPPRKIISGIHISCCFKHGSSPSFHDSNKMNHQAACKIKMHRSYSLLVQKD